MQAPPRVKTDRFYAMSSRTSFHSPLKMQHDVDRQDTNMYRDGRDDAILQ